MEQEFEGQLFDLSEDEEDETGEEEEETNEEKLDNEMGDTGEDGNVVDEKLWEEENEKTEDQQEQEKFEKNAPISNAGEDDIEFRGQDEDVAEEDVEERKDVTEKEETERKEEKEGQDNEEMEEDDKENGEESTGRGKEEQEEESHGIQPEKEEELELPEDMQLDGESEGEEEEGGEMDITEGGVQEDHDENDNMDVDNEHQTEDNMDEAEENNREEDNNLMEQSDVGNEEQTGEEENKEQVQEIDDTEKASKPGEEIGEMEEKSQITDQVVEKQYGGEKSAEEAVGVKGGGNGNEMDQGEENPSNFQSNPVEDSDAKNARDKQSQGNSQEKTEGEESKTNKYNERQELNSERILGDMLKKWRERVRILGDEDKIGDTEEKKNNEIGELEKENEGDEFEYTEQEEKGGEQALGAATEDQVKDMDSNWPKLNDGEENEDKGEMEDVMEEDIQKEEDLENTEPESKQIGGKAKKQPDSGNKEDFKDIEKNEVLNDELDEELGKLDIDEDKDERKGGLGFFQMNKEPTVDEAELTEEEVSIVRKQLEEQILTDHREEKLQSENEFRANARETWRKYEAIVNSLSHDLAEQLRLILEPTVATKLEGDYRTGKRINMKKVVPF